MLERYSEKNSFIERLCLTEEAHNEITSSWKVSHFNLASQDQKSDLFAYSELLKLTRRGYFSEKDCEKYNMKTRHLVVENSCFNEEFIKSYAPTDLSESVYQEFVAACFQCGYLYPNLSRGLFYIVDYILNEMIKKSGRDRYKGDGTPLLIGFTQGDHEVYEEADECIYSLLTYKAKEPYVADKCAEEICHYIEKELEINSFTNLLKFANLSRSFEYGSIKAVDDAINEILTNNITVRLVMRTDVLRKIGSIYREEL